MIYKEDSRVRLKELQQFIKDKDYKPEKEKISRLKWGNLYENNND